MKKKHLLNIQRIDDDTTRTHAWYVQVQREKRTAKKMFSDGLYGGKRAELEAAIAFRDACIGDTEFKHKVWRCNLLRRNNTSGVAGVGRYNTLRKANSTRRAAFWLACWTDEHGKRHRRKFYVSTYGEEKARELAIQIRAQELSRMSAIKPRTTSAEKQIGDTRSAPQRSRTVFSHGISATR